MSAESPDLFPEARSLSPRRAWLERHGLVLRRQAGGRWECWLDEANHAAGITRDDACAAFCIKTGLAHWNNPRGGIA